MPETGAIFLATKIALLISEHESREEAQELFTSSYTDWDRLKLGMLLDQYWTIFGVSLDLD